MGRNTVKINVSADTAQAAQQISNFSSELSRSKRSVRDLTAAYEQLDSKTKNSSIGRQMQSDLNSAITRYREMSSIQNKVKENLDSVSVAANGTNNSVNTLGGGIGNLTSLFGSNNSILGTLGGTVSSFAGFLGVATTAGSFFNEMMDNSQTLGDAVERAQTQAGNAVDYFAQCITQCDFSNFLSGLRSAIDEAGKLADVLDDLATRQLNLGLSDSKFNYKKQKLMTQYRGTNDKGKRKQILSQLDKLTEDNAKEIADVAKRSFKASNQLIRSKIQGKMGKVKVTDGIINSYFRDPNKANAKGAKTAARIAANNRRIQANSKILEGAARMSMSGGYNSVYFKKAQKARAENAKLQKQNAYLKKGITYAWYQISQMQDRDENDPYTQAVKLRKDFYGGMTNAEQQRTMNARLRSQLYRSSGSRSAGGSSGHKSSSGHVTKVNKTSANTESFNPGSIAAMNQALRQLQIERDNLADPTKIAAVDEKIQSIKDNIVALNLSARMINFDKIFGKVSLQDQLKESGLGSIKPIPGEKKEKFDVDSTDLKSVGDTISDWNEKMKESDPVLQSMKEQLESISEAGKDAFENFGGDMKSNMDMFTTLNKVFASNASVSTKAGAGIAVLGQTLQQIGADGDVAKAGAILAAIGQITLGFANASVQAASLGPLGWIAWVGAGLAALTTAISTMQSFNDGGIVSGSSTTTGDNTLVRVNRGEMILNNRQQAHLFKMLDGGLALNTQSSGGSVNFKISGSNLYGTLKNYSNMQSKVGRNIGIK